MKVWIDDGLRDGDAASVPVRDHGLLYGDGVFEGIRVYARRVFRLDAHLGRLELGTRAVGIELPGGVERMRHVVLETARAFGGDDAYLRLVVTRGDGPLGIDTSECGTPRVICIADELELFSDEQRRRGLALVTVSQRRPTPDVLDPRVKSLNYMTSVLARREARLAGADDALLLNRDGCVAEASVANVFAYRRGVLRTPSALDGALEGITREAVLELAAGLGIPCSVERLGRIDLLGADEVFLTGTGIEIAAVRSLDHARVGTGADPVPGPLTRKLEAAFGDLTRSSGTPL
ncbi:MAG: aminotransferase class IV [Deltaproteobacteria bacterium]|nr:aminotransferase class IV [Deltaproteobacteria bacterium]MBW2414177.1 aminotransferase class IV [Deltaproteobacteria bacterium]